ncbi:hypothetical protein [Streptomyces flaveolus]|uniref:hypothetical protein n=1 Tax=Streptomyces flaveolus TaxID=67297 RepID=UPI003F5408BF
MPTLRTVLCIPMSLMLPLAPAAVQDASLDSVEDASPDASRSISPAAAADAVLPPLVSDGGAPPRPRRPGHRPRRPLPRRQHHQNPSSRRPCSGRPPSTRSPCPTPWSTTLLELIREHGTDGRRITLRTLLSHTSGLADFAQTTRDAAPLTSFQAIRITLALPAAHPARCSCSSTD